MLFIFGKWVVILEDTFMIGENVMYVLRFLGQLVCVLTGWQKVMHYKIILRKSQTVGLMKTGL